MPGASRTEMAARTRDVRTTADGTFRFGDVANGTFNVGAVADAYAPGSYGRNRPNGDDLEIVVLPESRRADLVVKIWRAASIAGVIRDSSGRTLAGASVFVLARSVLGDESRYYPRTPVRADAAGRYRLADLQPGEYFVGVSMTQVTLPLSVEARFSDLQGQGRVAMAPLLRPLVTSAGWLPNGAGDVVGPHRLQDNHRGPTRPPGDASGGDFDVYRQTLHPAAETLAAAAPVAVAPAEDRAGVDIEVAVERGHRVAGRLVDPSGDPVGFVGVHLIAAPEAGRLKSELAFAQAGTVTGADGTFTMLGVPAGRYELWVVRAPLGSYGAAPSLPPPDRLAAGMRAVFSRPDAWARAEVTVTDAPVDGIELHLRPTLTISGVVSFDGTMPADDWTRQLIRVGALPIGPYAFPQPDGVRIDAQGRFEIAGFVPGVYRITGRAAGGWQPVSSAADGRDVLDRPFELTDDLTNVRITFGQPRTSLSVALRLGPDEDPASVGVLVFPADIDGWIDRGAPGRWLRSHRAPGRGTTLDVADVPEGDYLVAAFVDEIARHFDRGFFLRLGALGTRVTLRPGEPAAVTVGVMTVGNR
jgi:hypothetical protein